jgi:hypothetical protein
MSAVESAETSRRDAQGSPSAVIVKSKRDARRGARGLSPPIAL